VALPVLFSAERRRSFLSQAGPRFKLDCVKLSITSEFRLDLGYRNDEGDPVGRPRLARHAARNLARRAPSEGEGTVGPALLIEPVPARQSPRGDRRFGGDLSDVG
jgi:hypothetical protein